MITEDYVSFETAKLLKEKGFDEECNKVIHQDTKNEYYFGNYTDDIKGRLLLVPTLQMAMKWLREVYNINIDIVPIWNKKQFEYQVFIVTPENANHCYVDDKLYLGYEEACEVAIKYCLEHLI